MACARTTGGADRCEKSRCRAAVIPRGRFCELEGLDDITLRFFFCLRGILVCDAALARGYMRNLSGIYNFHRVTRGRSRLHKQRLSDAYNAAAGDILRVAVLLRDDLR